MKNLKTEKRLRRKSKIKNRIRGTKEMPRLTVYRSNKHIYAQLIDDSIGKTIVAASDAKVKKRSATEKSN
ncbi:MAG: 50S ribosomal protein L18 [candidate division WS6 bacterium OLB21]|uniref:50S ribosomal protein L18 n=1 Tax=candidate division WS6 bacterium OLB21 TaxID=1617427 RepID=A0A136KL84_9BACT|nr:MAG: 50S ribosomal protein L18 [candidate division WS6 bacterium OLB21]